MNNVALSRSGYLWLYGVEPVGQDRDIDRHTHGQDESSQGWISHGVDVDGVDIDMTLTLRTANEDRVIDATNYGYSKGENLGKGNNFYCHFGINFCFVKKRLSDRHEPVQLEDDNVKGVADVEEVADGEDWTDLANRTLVIRQDQYHANYGDNDEPREIVQLINIKWAKLLPAGLNNLNNNGRVGGNTETKDNPDNYSYEAWDL